MIDLCTVVFEPELDILQFQARSVDRYLNDVGTIYVVVNDATPCNKINPEDWGRHKSRVQILNRKLFGSHWSNNGWVSQQCIKIAVAAVSQAPQCVALDAKTIFVRSLPHVVQSDKLAVGTLPVYPVFEASRRIVNQLWNIDLNKQLGPGGVPFWFDPRQVRAMVADIEHRVQQNFVSWFQNQGLLTEFLLYSGWLLHQNLLDTMVLPSVLNVVNLCHSELALADQKLSHMQSSHTVSIHRQAWPALSAAQRKQYIDLLEQRL